MHYREGQPVCRLTREPEDYLVIRKLLSGVTQLLGTNNQPIFVVDGVIMDNGTFQWNRA